MNKLRRLSSHAVTKGVLALMLVTAPLMAQSRELTYDLNVQVFLTLPGGNPTPYATFSGSFMFNTKGTAFCSAAFCPSGATPDFTNVHINNPLIGGSSFTEVSPVGPGVGPGVGPTFADYYGVPPPNWSSTFVADLSLGINEHSLEHGAKSISITSASYSVIGKGSFVCGGLIGPDEVTSCDTSLRRVHPTHPPHAFAVAMISSSSVPEPGTLSLLVVALVGMAVIRIRRHPAATST